MLTIEQITPSGETWARVAKLDDTLVYHTPEWLRFIAEAQGARPVLGAVRDGSSTVGYLHGLVFKRFGVPLFGSPFPGWTTMYMGFSLEPSVPRALALDAVPRFVFDELGCVHFELVDRKLHAQDGSRTNIEHGFIPTYVSDLRLSEEELFSGMTSACRRCIRKADKSGVVIEEAEGSDHFAFQYYEQMRDVFAKQGLVPTYGVERIRKLIEHVHPPGHLLLLRALAPDGRCIATGIYAGFNHVAQFWGNASFRTDQHLRPNEALHWSAMRWWKARGVEVFDWGGGGKYKEKYGCTAISVPRFYESRYRILTTLREAARAGYRGRQRVRGWLSTGRGSG